jgi:hypothetical protein
MYYIEYAMARGSMNKYQPLEDFLAARNEAEVPMTFQEIERVIGAKLPRSAWKHRPWWSNNESSSIATRSWMRAGFRSADVDMAAHRLVFRRLTGRATPSAVDEEAGAYAVQGRHPLRGALKGAIRVARGADLTAPADPEWGGTGG